MKKPDWETILSEFRADMVSRKSYSEWQFSHVQEFAGFLEAGSHTHLSERLLIEWMQERMAHTTLEHMFIELGQLGKFFCFLEQKGMCPSGLLDRVRKNPAILEQLKGPRLYYGKAQLSEYWQKILFSCEASLRGFAPAYIARILRAAGEMACFHDQIEVTSLDKDKFLEWLDWKLPFYEIATVVSNLQCIERFFQILMERGDCSSNPVREWRQGQPDLAEALERRREGKPPRFRPPMFRSFLAASIEAFRDHKRSLGYKYERVPALEYFDSYLRKHKTGKLSEVNASLVLDFLSNFPQWKPSTRGKAIVLLKHFFHFMERRGELSPHNNPARDLFRVVVPPYIPYIFTIKEIAAILSDLQKNETRPDFDNQMLFTFFHLTYACALRISEAMKLQVNDVNLKEGTLFIRKTKFGKSRLIAIGRRAGEYLALYRQERQERLGNPKEIDPFFVRSMGKPYSCSRLEYIFRQACKREEVGQHLNQKPRVHDLRHSAAVHRLYKWYQEGADPQEKLVLLSIYMGHVRIEHTQHYLHISEDLLRIAGRPLERSLAKWLDERQVFQFDE